MEMKNGSQKIYSIASLCQHPRPNLGSQYPYYNEPGVEQSCENESSHLAARTSNNGGYERLRIATIQHAMIGLLQNPTPGFDLFIKEHFRMKQSYIIRQIKGWIEEAGRNKTPGHKLELEKLLKQLRVEFEALGEVPMPAKTTQYSYETYPF